MSKSIAARTTMIILEENVGLRPFNSFNVDAMARYYCRVTTEAQLQELISLPLFRQMPHFAVGDGSNILFTRDYAGIIVHIAIRGITLVNETEDHVVISVGAGETWHQLVLYCVAKNWGGIENLSLIPGTTGAAPIQNIGAYGVEIENRIVNVTGIDVGNGARKIFSRDECRFEYRESVFKHDLREKYFISSITLSLTKKNHFFNISYGAVRDTLHRHEIVREDQLTVKAISDAVIEIRKQKLPEVGVIGSAGSFFKNPTVTQAHFDSLVATYPLMPSYPSVNQHVKIPAGWLIEQCGWKGKRIGSIGVHEHQALVIVNYGGGKGKEIFDLAMMIQRSVMEKFQVHLETEVNII